jgi:endonuclease/exonuclease/phosphatase family metal-dependent hydrolase
LEKIKAIAGNAPIILMGDFNSIMTSIPYLSITKNSGDQTLVDAYTSSLTPHHGPLGSFSGNFTLPGVGDYRIDYVFVNKSIVVLKHAIISDSWDGRLPSDHLPVLAEIYIP